MHHRWETNPERFSYALACCVVYVTDVSTFHMTGILGKSLLKKLVPYGVIMLPHVAVRHFSHWEWVLGGIESQPFLRDADYAHKATWRLILYWRFKGKETTWRVINLKYYTIRAEIKLVRKRVFKNLSISGFFFPFPFNNILFLLSNTSVFPNLIFSIA